MDSVPLTIIAKLRGIDIIAEGDTITVNHQLSTVN